jgi:hypothetical protein
MARSTSAQVQEGTRAMILPVLGSKASVKVVLWDAMNCPLIKGFRISGIRGSFLDVYIIPQLKNVILKPGAPEARPTKVAPKALLPSSFNWVCGYIKEGKTAFGRTVVGRASGTPGFKIHFA